MTEYTEAGCPACARKTMRDEDQKKKLLNKKKVKNYLN